MECVTLLTIVQHMTCIIDLFRRQIITFAVLQDAWRIRIVVHLNDVYLLHAKPSGYLPGSFPNINTGATIEHSDKLAHSTGILNVTSVTNKCHSLIIHIKFFPLCHGYIVLFLWMIIRGIPSLVFNTTCSGMNRKRSVNTLERHLSMGSGSMLSPLTSSSHASVETSRILLGPYQVACVDIRNMTRVSEPYPLAISWSFPHTLQMHRWDPSSNL